MSEIRKVFTSRWPEGQLLELDFSQLEIYALAYLSGDSTLKSDLLSGQDLHGISATLLFGRSYTPEQRKIAKQLSFQLQYGAGCKSMADRNDISEELAKTFIDNYYTRYHEVKAWHDSILVGVPTFRKSSEYRTKTGLPAGVAKWESLTGRQYTFIEEDSPSWMQKSWSTGTSSPTSFSPTKLKNYPVQGFATGDIVPMVLGKLYRTLKSLPKYDGSIKMVNTVHDSVLFDCEDKEWAMLWAFTAKATMEQAPLFLKEIFDIDFDLPLPVEISVGSDWHDMKQLT